MKMRNPKAGLTLLETMVALAIMAMMAVMVSGGLATGARVMARSGAEGALLQQAVARHELRGWIEQALTAPVPGDARPVFIGNAQGLSALVVPEKGVFWPGEAVLVTVASDGSVVASGQTADRQPAVQSRRIAPEGHGLQFRYWGRTDPTDPPRWHQDWPASTGLPDLVKITFTGSGVDMPDMTLRPAKAREVQEMNLLTLLPPLQVAQ